MEEVGLSRGGLPERTLDEQPSCGKWAGLLGRFGTDIGLWDLVTAVNALGWDLSMLPLVTVELGPTFAVLINVDVVVDVVEAVVDTPCVTDGGKNGKTFPGSCPLVGRSRASSPVGRRLGISCKPPVICSLVPVLWW
jgi:hypothetical protein